MLETQISMALLDIGIPMNLSGFKHIVHAVKKCMQSQNFRIRLTGEKGVYAEIAKEYAVNPIAIERNIRHAIEVAFLKGNTDSIEKYFGNISSGESGKLTNGEFIYTLAGRLLLMTNGRLKNVSVS